MIRGFTASAFDLGPHAGHIAMFIEAKKHCDYLIVALHVNPSAERSAKNKPQPALSQRYFQLKACRYVDEIVPYETEEELIQLLCLYQPDVRFLGDDYRDKDFTGKALGIPVVYCSRSHGLSSSGLRQKIKEETKHKDII